MEDDQLIMKNEKKSAALKLRWQNPEYRKKMLAQINDPVNIEKRKIALQKFREKNPGYFVKLAIRMRKWWANMTPEKKAVHIEKMKQGFKNRKILNEK